MDISLTAEETEILHRLREDMKCFERSRPQMIPVLQWVQEAFKYLPHEAMDLVADYLGIPLADVYGVATFYNQFRFNPPGKYPIKVCMGTACHVKGGEIILENFERKLGIAEGQTSADRQFSIERVACVGCCALAPVALMGEMVHGHMAPSKVEGIFTRIQVEQEMAQRKRGEG